MISRRSLLAIASALTLAPASALASRARVLDTSLAVASGRQFDVRVFAPPINAPRCGFIVFSHGANSSGRLYDPLLSLIAASGFVVAAPTHVDSEANPTRANFDQAAIFQTRLDDLKRVTDSAAQLAGQVGVAAGHLDPAALIIAGHSYGAWQALMLVGAGCAAFGIGGGQLADPRFKAALAISPPGAVPGMISMDDFAGISTPVLVTTGRRDVLPGFVERWEDRLLAYERATVPAGALIMPDVDHYFGGIIGRTSVPGPRQTRSLRTTAAIVGRFARAYGMGDMAELARLKSMPSPRLDLRLRNMN
jgi:pimeloyl-ACP methyl ester carboxylesterase